MKLFSNKTKKSSANQLDVAIRSALTEVSAAVMMVDRDFIVTYVNNATKKLFTDHAEVFKKAFPDFKPENIVGTNIDIFHRNPAHQRKLLADPSNLPFVTDIKLGELTVNLYVTATYDTQGNYTGNVLEWRDVTEERARQQQDLDNAGKLEAINRSQGVIEFDLDANVIDVNENFLSVVGYEKAEILGKHHSMFVDKAYAQSDAYTQLWNDLRDGKIQSGRFKRFNKAGEPVWIEASYNPVFDTQGKPYKFVKYATDITAQVKLEEQSKTLSLVANETDNSVVITNAKGLIEYVNRGFTALTGYSLDEVKGKKPGEFLQGELTDKETVKRISQKLQSGEAFYEEILNYNKNGNTYWISLAINPVFDEHGNLDKFVSIQTNINETKVKTLEFLGKLDAISNVSAVIELKAEGIITDANENFLNTVGYTLDEIKGKHHRIFVDKNYQQTPEYAAFWERLGAGKTDIGEYHRIGKDGSDIWLSASYNSIFDQNGKGVKVVKIATDITQQHKIQEALKVAVDESRAVIEQAKNGDIAHRIELSEKTDELEQLSRTLIHI